MFRYAKNAVPENPSKPVTPPKTPTPGKTPAGAPTITPVKSDTKQLQKVQVTDRSKAQKSVLPKTNEASTSWLALIGMGMLSIVTALGSVLARKKN